MSEYHGNYSKSLRSTVLNFLNIPFQTSCNARIGELKRIQESLSDFQKSNVEKMDSINTRGIYHIEATPGRIIHSPDNAVYLTMRRGADQTEQQEKILLDDLRELQSKLVLVAAENADKVNKFIEVRVHALIID